MINTRSLEQARAKLPAIPDDLNENARHLLETAVTALVALQMSATAAALHLCRRQDADADLDELALSIRNHVSTFHHILDVYRGLRDKPEVTN